jgi:hypothetical protein
LDWSKLKSLPDGVFDCYSTTVTLLGLVPSVIELAVSRSNAIDSALEQLVAAIVGEVQSLGYMVRESKAADRHRPIHSLTRHFGM